MEPMQIDPMAAYEHVKREAAQLYAQLLGDLAAKSAAIDQIAAELKRVSEERDRLATRLAELEPPANGKPAAETLEKARQLAKGAK